MATSLVVSRRKAIYENNIPSMTSAARAVVWQSQSEDTGELRRLLRKAEGRDSSRTARASCWVDARCAASARNEASSELQGVKSDPNTIPHL